MRYRIFTDYGLIGPTRDFVHNIPHAWTYTRQVYVLRITSSYPGQLHNFTVNTYARSKISNHFLFGNWIPVIIACVNALESTTILMNPSAAVLTICPDRTMMSSYTASYSMVFVIR